MRFRKNITRGPKPRVNWFYCLSILAVIAILSPCKWAQAEYPLTFTDTQGQSITIEACPERAVSLIPAITEIILKIGAGDALRAITYHSANLYGAAQKTVIGGFGDPSLTRIDALKPDVIFYADHHQIVDHYRNQPVVLINLKSDSIASSFKTIQRLGQIFDRETEAQRLVEKIEAQLDVIAQKLDHIPVAERKRVMRIMGREQIMTPGVDSFQNEMIRAAGGIPPDFVRPGAVVEVDPEEWTEFDPQVLYGCGADREVAQQYFSQPGWKGVAAIENRQVYYFPCDLTCRVATHTGAFVSWLAARTYPDEFSCQDNLVRREEVVATRKVAIDLDCIAEARIVHSYLWDFLNKTLVVDFKAPMDILSTLDGPRQGIETIGNHFAPIPCWVVSHSAGGMDHMMTKVHKMIDRKPDTASLLFTGADMDNLSIQRQSYQAMQVCALVTAGVTSNAMRMGLDTGSYYEPGTINIIIISNYQLTRRAMARAVITATEAKTAALMDMDVRSSYQPMRYQATGTGTDNIIVVQGSGAQISKTGGHTKMGELIARAVYTGVQEAVYLQNGLTANRNIFQRLKERHISPYGVVALAECDCYQDRGQFVRVLEELLLDVRYAEFIAGALALSDDYEAGQLKDLAAFDGLCLHIATQVAGTQITQLNTYIDTERMPRVVQMAFNALLNGIARRTAKAQP